jgi:hypothetical protein
MTANYRWKITVDHIADTSEPEGTNLNAVGMEGPWNLDTTIPLTQKFKIYDDDGELYYEGEYGENDNAHSDDVFGPLNDFGDPNAGATEIHYQNENGEWEMM